jgi:hypothetical protein
LTSSSVVALGSRTVEQLSYIKSWLLLLVGLLTSFTVVASRRPQASGRLHWSRDTVTALQSHGSAAKSQETELLHAVCTNFPRAGTARESAEPCRFFSKQSVSSVATETLFIILWFSVDRRKSDGDSLCF